MGYEEAANNESICEEHLEKFIEEQILNEILDDAGNQEPQRAAQIP